MRYFFHISIGNSTNGDETGTVLPLCPRKMRDSAMRAIVEAIARRGPEPVVPRQSDCEGERGTGPCLLPLTRTVAWASSPNEQGRELEDATDGFACRH